MAKKSKKETIAIYCNTFLTISMTFIYRQIKGVENSFNPVVLTRRKQNAGEFPHNQVFDKEMNFIDRIYSGIYRAIFQKYTKFSWSQYKFFKKVIEEHDVKMIHAHFGPSALNILPLCKRLNLPLLVTFHGYDMSSLLNDKTYFSNLKELFNYEYTYIISVSKKMAGILGKIGANRSRIYTHYIGVPMNDFKFIKRKLIKEKIADKEKIEFLQVSNFVEKKGHKYTILAFKEFVSKFPNSRLTLGGDGPLRANIEILCENLDMGRKVKFLGKISKPEVIEEMKRADLFLHHSVTAENGDKEGIPTVIMEAMAMGLPVISTYHSGIPELIDDGISGFLVEEKDVGGYVSAINKIIECDHEMGEEAFQTISSNFNLNVQNKKLVEIYKEILDDAKN
ncbi:MAG: glycosyltransferase [Promethearchaeota archaeon]